MFRYLAALFDHIAHYSLAPAHRRVENRAALARLKATDRAIATGAYQGPDFYGSPGWAYQRLSPRDRLVSANRVLDGEHGHSHLPLTNPATKITVPHGWGHHRRWNDIGAHATRIGDVASPTWVDETACYDHQLTEEQRFALGPHHWRAMQGMPWMLHAATWKDAARKYPTTAYRRGMTDPLPPQIIALREANEARMEEEDARREAEYAALEAKLPPTHPYRVSPIASQAVLDAA